MDEIEFTTYDEVGEYKPTIKLQQAMCSGMYDPRTPEEMQRDEIFALSRRLVKTESALMQIRNALNALYPPGCDACEARWEEGDY